MTFLVQEKAYPASGVVLCASRNAITERFWKWSSLAPRESRLATGRIVTALFENSSGLSKFELLSVVTGENLAARSLGYVEALEAAVNKRIQRSRARVRQFGLDIAFDRRRQLWFLETFDKPSSSFSPQRSDSRLSAS